jgi:uncharacterized protein YhhL (DUF1145 family)
MSQRAMKSFRKLTWLAIALFWAYALFWRIGFPVDILYCLVFTVGFIVCIQGLQVFMYIVRESEESLENHDKIYKALEPLEDIEDSNC